MMRATRSASSSIVIWKSAVRLSFHPNINTVTYVVSAADFTRFLEVCGNPVQHVTV